MTSIIVSKIYFKNDKKMRSTNLKKKELIGLTLILTMLIPSLLMNLIPNTNNIFITNEPSDNNENSQNNEEGPHLSLPPATYGWWNVSWDFRIPVSISSADDQTDAPVELFVNFTEYFNDLSVDNPWLDKTSIRVIEYESASQYWEINCQFDEYYRIYDNETNAIGDVIWILNGSTPVGTTRDFFIYFNNGSVSQVPTDYYTDLRIWHEGFETYYIGDIRGGISGQDTYPTSGYWEISNTTSARGQSALHIWGNCWKDEELTGFSFGDTPNVKVTAKMRFDDPDIDREISGIGFHNVRNSIPSPGNSYEIRGSQNWGTAEGRIYDDVYYAANTFFWYTLSYIAYDKYLFFIADDDSYTNRDLYWDDISIWDISISDVQTVPDAILQITTGDVEPATFRLEVTCLDEDGTPVPGATVYISNSSQPELNDEEDSDISGIVNFIDLEKNGIYNITVNYTQDGLANPKTETIFSYENYEIKKLTNKLTAFLNLSTYYFNVTDNDGDPIKYGYVKLINQATATDVGIDTLNENGNATLRWINDTVYDYEVYFDYNSLPDISTYYSPEMRIIDTTPIPGTFVNVPTDISKVTFNVTEESSGDPFVNAKIRVTNQTGGGSIANITTLIDGSATFISFGEGHGSWGSYRFDIFFAGQTPSFEVNDSTGQISDYTFKLNKEYNINVSVNFANSGSYNCTYLDVSYTNQILWGENFSITFNFTYTEPGMGYESVAPNEMYIQILDGELDPYSQKISILADLIPLGPTGLYNYTFNTTKFSLIGDTYYFIQITGEYLSYVPASLQEQIYIIPIGTGMSIHDYDTFSTIAEISGFYSEKINISIRYYDDSDNSLKDARLNYEWKSDPVTIVDSGDIYADPRDDNYYTFELDLSLADADTYFLEISAILENYSTQENFYFLEVKPRTTSINGVEKLVLITKNIYVTEGYNFTFEYNDTLKTPTQRIGNLDKYSYFWYKLNDAGNPITEASEDINLIATVDDKYILDFDTENQAIGNYKLIVTLEKQNYETSSAIIDLKINLRIIDVDLDAKGLEDDQVSVVKGNTIKFEIKLTDEASGEKIRDAKVTLEIGDDEFEFDEDEPGVYTYTFDTEEYEAFYSSKTLTGEIIIKKNNYESEELDITIVIEMEEVYPGIPMFYFIMVVGAIAAVVASLGTYKYIQIARIPKFVKKARAMKKAIKANKGIPDSALTDLKNEMIFKQFGNEWDEIGISLSNILSLEAKKPKANSNSSDSINKRGGAE